MALRSGSVRNPARALLGLLLVAALTVPAAPALAWANNADGYGMHDWIIDQAVRVTDGRVDDWFDARIARLASDDPDTLESDRRDVEAEHVYRGDGKRGGGVNRIANEYDLAQAAYATGAAAREAGDEAGAEEAFDEASYHLGLLSHIIGDLSQPFHTNRDGIDLDSIHKSYELMVSGYTHAPDDMPAWQSGRRTVTAISDIRKHAAGTAAHSRGLFDEVISRLRADGVKLTPRLSELQGHLMRRVANDLADILWSVEQGTGAQPQVGSIKLRLNWTGVASSGYQSVHATVLDTAGKPIEGIRVNVAWPTSTGTRLEILYTDSSGYQKRYATVGSSPRQTRLDVTASTTVRGVTTTARTWWAITPRLGTYRTVVSDATVVPEQVAKVTTIAKDGAGRPVRNLLVDWTWKLPDGTRIVTRAVTDAYGKARGSLTIPTGMVKGRITVVAHTQSASANRSVTVYLKRV